MSTLKEMEQQVLKVKERSRERLKNLDGQGIGGVNE